MQRLSTLSDTQTADDLMSYINSLSKHVRKIVDYFHFEDYIEQLFCDEPALSGGAAVCELRFLPQG